MAAPTGMEWKQYSEDLTSISDIMSGKAKPGIAGMILGNIIDSFAGGPTDMGKNLGAGKQMFGGPAVPPQPNPAAPVAGAPLVNAPVANAPVVPPAPGQSTVTQPQYMVPQTPVPEAQSYTRFLFAPK